MINKVKLFTAFNKAQVVIINGYTVYVNTYEPDNVTCYFDDNIMNWVFKDQDIDIDNNGTSFVFSDKGEVCISFYVKHPITKADLDSE